MPLKRRRRSTKGRDVSVNAVKCSQRESGGDGKRVENLTEENCSSSTAPETAPGGRDSAPPWVKGEPPTGPFIRGGTILVLDSSGKLVDFNEEFCKTTNEGVHQRYSTVVFPGRNGEPEVRQIIVTVDPKKGAISYNFNSLPNVFTQSGNVETDRPIKEEPLDEAVQLEADKPIKVEPSDNDRSLRRSPRKKCTNVDEEVVIVDNGKKCTNVDEEVVIVDNDEGEVEVEERAQPRRTARQTSQAANKKNASSRSQAQKKQKYKEAAEGIDRKLTKITGRKKPGYVRESTITDVSTSKTNAQSDIPCPFCDARLSRKDFLRAHIAKAHTRKKEERQLKHPRRKGVFPCADCVYVACTPYILRMHRKGVHDRIKDFDCRLCERSFTYNAQLKRHILLVHEKLKPHRCEDCKKYFGTKTQLKTHRNAVHEKVKTAGCPTCGLKFLFPSALKRHIDATHLGVVEQHKCSLCKFASKYKFNLKSHMENVHGPKAKAFTCSFCDYRALRKIRLQMHLSKKHKL